MTAVSNLLRARGYQIDSTPGTDRVAGEAYVDSVSGKTVIACRDMEADVTGSVYADGVFRCLKANPQDVFSVGDLLQISSAGAAAGSLPIEVIQPSQAGEKYVIAELNRATTDAVASSQYERTFVINRPNTNENVPPTFAEISTWQNPYDGDAVTYATATLPNTPGANCAVRLANKIREVWELTNVSPETWKKVDRHEASSRTFAMERLSTDPELNSLTTPDLVDAVQAADPSYSPVTDLEGDSIHVTYTDTGEERFYVVTTGTASQVTSQVINQLANPAADTVTFTSHGLTQPVAEGSMLPVACSYDKDAGTIAFTDSDSESTSPFNGFIVETVDANTVKVRLAAQTERLALQTLSGVPALTPGAMYYLQSNGTFGTTPTQARAFLAWSATDFYYSHHVFPFGLLVDAPPLPVSVLDITALPNPWTPDASVADTYRLTNDRGGAWTINYPTNWTGEYMVQIRFDDEQTTPPSWESGKFITPTDNTEPTHTGEAYYQLIKQESLAVLVGKDVAPTTF